MAIGFVVALFTMPLSSLAENVTIVANSSSGIENASHTATLSDGTIMGFCNAYGSWTFVGAISTRTSLTIPDSLFLNSSSTTDKYPVKRVGYYGVDMSNAQNVTSLTFPPTIIYIYDLQTAPNIKTLHAQSYISNIQSTCLSEVTKMLVPSSTLSQYLGNVDWYDYVLINAEGTNPLKITINMTKPGELAQLILQHTNDWKNVNELTVIGEMNADDMAMFHQMRQLTLLDLSHASLTDLPNYGYYNSGSGVLETVKLPNNLNTIGDYAFYACRKLKNVSMPKVTTIGYRSFRETSKLESITLPSGLSSIAAEAFAYSGLKSIIIPNTVTIINDDCFYRCENLATVTLPSTVTEIGYSAFIYCSSLTNVSMPGVKIIHGSAFQECTNLQSISFPEGFWKFDGSNHFKGCTALTEVVLPASLREVNDSPFYNCTGIKKVTCLAVTPPTHNNKYAFMYGCDMTNVKLYVPAMSIDAYRAESGWKTFYTILPLEGTKLNDVLIYDDKTIDDPSLFTTNCNVTLDYFNQNRNGSNQYYCGTVDYVGTSTWSLGSYNQVHYLGTYSGSDLYFYDSHHTALIANGTMRANNVKTTLYTRYKNIWYFISLPYDVKVSDITYTDGTQFVIRKYSGLNRAQSQSNTWQNLTPDSIMHAYEGYILRCNRDEQITFEFPAMNNGNKNNIFQKDNAVVPLKEYLSEFDHNRSWNLIGNPYPCFYDTRFMDFTAPITVWNRNNSRYDAYSPIDDSFILRPDQAFFVQRPVGKANITFNKEGRQKNSAVRTLNMAGKRVAADRILFNIVLTSGENEDHTRFVFNDDASRSYELDKDASKLIADDNTSLLVYTLENGVKYAINERDFANGQVNLGFYAPEDGEYDLSLETNATEEVTLIDHENETQSSLLGKYTFKAEAGYNDARFTLVLGQSAIKELNNDNVVINVKNGIISSNVRCRVYTIDGRMIGFCDADNSINLEKGVYVICGNNVTRKIIVK